MEERWESVDGKGKDINDFLPLQRLVEWLQQFLRWRILKMVGRKCREFWHEADFYTMMRNKPEAYTGCKILKISTLLY